MCKTLKFTEKLRYTNGQDTQSRAYTTVEAETKTQRAHLDGQNKVSIKSHHLGSQVRHKKSQVQTKIKSNHKGV